MNLSQYCPSNEFQFKATCYAYAVAYTAMSTEYNIRNNILDKQEIETNYFSSGVVASRHNANLPFLKRSPRCGKFGTSEKALNILKKTGTIFDKDYSCNCQKFSKIRRKVNRNTFWYKIADFETLVINNTFSNDSVNWIKAALDDSHPIVISILQNQTLRSNQNDSLDQYSIDPDTQKRIDRYKNGVANHVVCILGYKDNYKNGHGYFLVKNNFRNWGNGQGFSWIPYVYLLPLIKKAHYITEIILPESTRS